MSAISIGINRGKDGFRIDDFVLGTTARAEVWISSLPITRRTATVLSSWRKISS
jgi:hypothetical protein